MPIPIVFEFEFEFELVTGQAATADLSRGTARVLFA